MVIAEVTAKREVTKSDVPSLACPFSHLEWNNTLDPPVPHAVHNLIYIIRALLLYSFRQRQEMPWALQPLCYLAELEEQRCILPRFNFYSTVRGEKAPRNHQQTTWTFTLTSPRCLMELWLLMATSQRGKGELNAWENISYRIHSVSFSFQSPGRERMR